MRHAALIAIIGLAACGRHVVPFTRAQLATVQQAVDDCTAASGRLTPYLKARDHAGSLNAAIAARNICSIARATIVTAVGTGTILDACYYTADRAEAVQQTELTNLDRPTLENGKAVAAALDEAIRQVAGCSTAIEAAGRGAS